VTWWTIVSGQNSTYVEFHCQPPLALAPQRLSNHALESLAKPD
jgi:hypothetical protein